MLRFYLRIWIDWIFRLLLESLILALFMAGSIVVFVYWKKGFPSLDQEVIEALGVVFSFWFSIVWGIGLLVALFRSLKFIFGKCYEGYRFALLTCDVNEEITQIGYGDLVKVWRKWLMLLVWIVTVLVLLGSVVARVVYGIVSIFEWLDIYVLFSFVLIAGYLSFWLLGVRCKRVKVVRC